MDSENIYETAQMRKAISAFTIRLFRKTSYIVAPLNWLKF